MNGRPLPEAARPKSPKWPIGCAPICLNNTGRSRVMSGELGNHMHTYLIEMLECPEFPGDLDPDIMDRNENRIRGREVFARLVWSPFLRGTGRACP